MIIMNKLQIIYNVNEWSFERSLKQEYSWFPKSGGVIINNINKGKASIILANRSDSSWFVMVKSETVNSYIFWIFLMLFWKSLAIREKSSLDTKVMIYDNARTHNSILIKKYYKQSGIKVRYLPPYSSEVALWNRCSECWRQRWELSD